MSHVPNEKECPSTTTNPSSNTHIHPLNTPFSLIELSSVHQHVHDSAPGIDGFPYSFITQAGDNCQKYFLNLINICFDIGFIPPTWKSQIIMPILKNGKPPDNPDYYRPIALSSVLAKLLEHLIKNRLEWIVENKGLLADSQYGFRKGYSTMDSISILISDIRIAFSRKESVVAVFLDISSAYDSVHLSILRYRLHQLNISDKMIQCICHLCPAKSRYESQENISSQELFGKDYLRVLY